MPNNLLQSVIDSAAANRAKALAKLEVYLTKAVAIGEHPDLTEEIEKLADEAAAMDDRYHVLNEFFDEEGHMKVPDDDEQART